MDSRNHGEDTHLLAQPKRVSPTEELITLLDNVSLNDLQQAKTAEITAQARQAGILLPSTVSLSRLKQIALRQHQQTERSRFSLFCCCASPSEDDDEPAITSSPSAIL